MWQQSSESIFFPRSCSHKPCLLLWLLICWLLSSVLPSALPGGTREMQQAYVAAMSRSNHCNNGNTAYFLKNGHIKSLHPSWTFYHNVSLDPAWGHCNIWKKGTENLPIVPIFLSRKVLSLCSDFWGRETWAHFADWWFQCRRLLQD